MLNDISQARSLIGAEKRLKDMKSKDRDHQSRIAGTLGHLNETL